MNLYNLLTGEINLRELLNYYNVTIDYLQMPKYINGFVFNHKDINVIAINSNLSYYKKRKTILHELAHIELGQLNQYDKDMAYLKIDKYEDEADRYVKFLLECINNG